MKLNDATGSHVAAEPARRLLAHEGAQLRGVVCGALLRERRLERAEDLRHAVASNEIVAVEIGEALAVAARRGPRLLEERRASCAAGRGSPASDTRARPSGSRAPPAPGSRSPPPRRRAARASARPRPRARSSPPRGSRDPSAGARERRARSACASASRPGSSERRGAVISIVRLCAGYASRSDEALRADRGLERRQPRHPQQQRKAPVLAPARRQARHALAQRGGHLAQPVALGGIERQRLRSRAPAPAAAAAAGARAARARAAPRARSRRAGRTRPAASG